MKPTARRLLSATLAALCAGLPPALAAEEAPAVAPVSAAEAAAEHPTLREARKLATVGRLGEAVQVLHTYWWPSPMTRPPACSTTSCASKNPSASCAG
jgi:hypothetical protein